MRTKLTRRRFLVAFGATYLTLTNTVGCNLLGRTSRIAPLHTPEVSPLHLPRKVLPSPSGSSAPLEGAWSFRSRPDLRPPVVDVAEKARHSTPGYIFIAPERGGAAQGGSMILEDSGKVVWFRPLQPEHGRPMNFKVQTYRGRHVLTWIETIPGEYVISDGSYHEIARIKAGNGYNGDHHEFLISPQDTALITIYSPVLWDLSLVGGPKNGVAVQGIAQELDIESGEVLFEWHSLDYVGIDESYAKPGQDADYPGIDYFHINSIDVDHDNNLLISARETSAVYKIDRRSGEVIWRLGGKRSDFEMGPGTRFAFQHDARRQPDGTITIFDNGTMVFRNGMPKAIEESRGIVLELDEQKMRASLVREYTHPDKKYADAAGNMQVLPNSNVLIGWGRALAITEFSNDGKILFDAKLPAENKSYRAFRFPWSAHPHNLPGAMADRTSEDEINVYARWNGATEVATWEVIAGTHPDKLQSQGSVPREGFETAMLVRTADPYVAVRAKDRLGQVLGVSKPVKL